MEHYEKLGVFYLGRPYDLAAKAPREGLILYESKHLVTHGVCVGMTGSGKTGLCLGLLEEAAIDGIPAIIIDPKGDMANLLLTFPELRPEDFRPWINEDDARKKGLSPDEYAGQQAELWRKGLAAWNQEGERIRFLKQAVDFTVYTPGSTAGIPVSIVKSFAAPSAAIIEDGELLHDRVSGTAASLLGLIGVTADPIKSREHILISTILSQAWQQGRDLDLAALIQQIQSPPVSQVGVMSLESFYPSRDRFSLALQLNNLLAAPGFAAWMQGEALDIDRILYTPSGKPRHSIFSIAHLGEAERMFFVALLLNQVLSWTRAQSGTTSLRAILYMDEIFGYFPPVANPPSKAPLLTLLKQARAFGVGVMLCTQNPVDLDYKGLSNTGTWFIGRLQTERDKMRVLDGLEGAASTQGTRFDRKGMEQILAGLGSRIFLMNNVNLDVPEIFETRWCMSYLRGPLTRTQIKALMDPVKALAPDTGAPSSRDGVQPAAAAVPAQVSPAPGEPAKDRPVLPPEIAQYYVPVRGRRSSGDSIVYHPALVGQGQLLFSDTKSGVYVDLEHLYATPVTGAVIPVDWDQAGEMDLRLEDLETVPEEGSSFAPLPSAAGNPKSYSGWSRGFADWLYRTRTLELLYSPLLKQYSQPGETERDFRIRLQQSSREQRDQLMEKLRQKYATRIASLEDKVRRADHAVQREAEQARQQQMQTAISAGAALLTSFMGKKPVSQASLGKASTAARGAGRYMKERQDVKQARETAELYRRQLQDLEREFKAEVDALAEKLEPLSKDLDRVAIRLTKKDITVKLVVLAWLPYRQGSGGAPEPAWQ